MSDRGGAQLLEDLRLAKVFHGGYAYVVNLGARYRVLIS